MIEVKCKCQIYKGIEFCAIFLHKKRSSDLGSFLCVLVLNVILNFFGNLLKLGLRKFQFRIAEIDIAFSL